MDHRITKFVKKLSNHKEIIGIALFGSHAREEQRPDSDVDLLILTKTKTYRDIIKFDGLNFEIVYATSKDAKDYYDKNTDNFVRFWDDAKILYDPQKILEKFNKNAQKIRLSGKSRPDLQKIKHVKFDFSDQIKAIEAMEDSDPKTAMMLSSILVFNMTNFYFDLNGLWTPQPKKLLINLRKVNPKLAQKIDNFYNEDKLKIKMQIIKKIVKLFFLNPHFIIY